jgi:hypothetical protein
MPILLFYDLNPLSAFLEVISRCNVSPVPHDGSICTSTTRIKSLKKNIKKQQHGYHLG